MGALEKARAVLSLKKVPVLLVVEKNTTGMASSIRQTLSGTRIQNQEELQRSDHQHRWGLLESGRWRL